MRALLAKLLTLPYDLLLLDEPTNFLDLNAALWLKDFLAEFSGAFIMISHDRDFLDDVTTCTLVLEHGEITKVKGNYEQYAKIHDEKRRHLLKKFNEIEKKREQLQRFIDRFHGQPNKAGQVRSKRTQLEKLEIIEVPPDRQDSIRKFHFPETKRSGHRIIQLEKMSKSYPEVQVYKEFDFEITRGEKAVLVGENGAGKSTLLKILSGILDIDDGKRIVGHNVDIGYFSQTRMDVLNSMNNVFEEAYNACRGSLPADTIRTILAAFFFVGDDVEKPVTVLSGGEKSRLILAKLLINPPNFLLLDEPTTHLDVDAVEALIKALKDYRGTLVCISHDIHFVRSIANTVYEVNQGRVRKFPGTFDYYWNKAKDLPTVDDTPSGPKTGKAKALKTDEEDKEKVNEHNEKIAKKIRRLRKEGQKLEIDRAAKMRIIENPRHGGKVIQQYQSQLKEIEERIHKIDIEIKRLKQSFKQT
jgi:ATP-binding cassette subfamily F protein 3